MGATLGMIIDLTGLMAPAGSYLTTVRFRGRDHAVLLTKDDVAVHVQVNGISNDEASPDELKNCKITGPMEHFSNETDPVAARTAVNAAAKAQQEADRYGCFPQKPIRV